MASPPFTASVYEAETRALNLVLKAVKDLDYFAQQRVLKAAKRYSEDNRVEHNVYRAEKGGSS